VPRRSQRTNASAPESTTIRRKAHDAARSLEGESLVTGPSGRAFRFFQAALSVVHGTRLCPCTGHRRRQVDVLAWMRGVGAALIVVLASCQVGHAQSTMPASIASASPTFTRRNQRLQNDLPRQRPLANRCVSSICLGPWEKSFSLSQILCYNPYRRAILLACRLDLG
jgi:hypothetical protein